LAPGAKLPREEDLAAELGVSRTVTREALQRLVALDVVDARHGQGYFLRAPDAGRAIRPEVLSLSTGPEALRQLFEARLALEPQLAAVAAARATADDLAEMRAALDALGAALTAGRTGTEHDQAFHRAMGRAARSPFLARLSDVVSTHLRAIRARFARWPRSP